MVAFWQLPKIPRAFCIQPNHCNETDVNKGLNVLYFQSNAYQQYTVHAITYTKLDMDYVTNMVCAQDMTARDCVALFDAVWAYAVALNNSIDALEEIGLTLSNYTFGEEKCTQIIQHQMYMLNFSGVVRNTIQFDPLNGYISSAASYIIKVNSTDEITQSLMG